MASGGGRREVCLFSSVTQPAPHFPFIIKKFQFILCAKWRTGGVTFRAGTAPTSKHLMALNRIHTHLGRLLAVWIAVAGLMAAEHHGTVKFGGLPVPGATVTATKGDKKLVTTTDENGRYAFADLSDGAVDDRGRDAGLRQALERGRDRLRRAGAGMESQVPADERHHGGSGGSGGGAETGTGDGERGGTRGNPGQAGRGRGDTGPCDGSGDGSCDNPGGHGSGAETGGQRPRGPRPTGECGTRNAGRTRPERRQRGGLRCWQPTASSAWT